jgi:hypothetical protein
MHFCEPPTNHIADDIGSVVSKTLTFEPSLILSKDARSPGPYADLAPATRALIAALAIEISVFGLLVWLIQLWSARQIVVAYSESRRPLHESVIGIAYRCAPCRDSSMTTSLF